MIVLFAASKSRERLTSARVKQEEMAMAAGNREEINNIRRSVRPRHHAERATIKINPLITDGIYIDTFGFDKLKIALRLHSRAGVQLSVRCSARNSLSAAIGRVPAVAGPVVINDNEILGQSRRHILQGESAGTGIAADDGGGVIEFGEFGRIRNGIRQIESGARISVLLKKRNAAVVELQAERIIVGVCRAAVMREIKIKPTIGGAGADYRQPPAAELAAGFGRIGRCRFDFILNSVLIAERRCSAARCADMLDGAPRRLEKRMLRAPGGVRSKRSFMENAPHPAHHACIVGTSFGTETIVMVFVVEKILHDSAKTVKKIIVV